MKYGVVCFVLSFLISGSAFAQEAPVKLPPEGSVGAVMEAPPPESTIPQEISTSAVPTPMPEQPSVSPVPSVTPIPEGVTPTTTAAATDPTTGQQPGFLDPAQGQAAIPDDTVKAMAYAYKYYTEGDYKKALEKLNEAQLHIATKVTPVESDLPIAPVPQEQTPVAPEQAPTTP